MNPKSGFTVAEVFMVLLLMVAVASIMITPVHRLVEQLNVRPLEVIVLSAVRDAHHEARSRNTGVFLINISESNALRIASQDGITLAEYAYGNEESAQAFDVRFYRVLPEDPERAGNVFEWEDEPTEIILFHPSGVSTPFAIRLREARKEMQLIMDPFSSYPIQREEDQ